MGVKNLSCVCCGKLHILRFFAMSVYFIQNTVTKAIKIGYTGSKVEYRLKSLQTGNEAKLSLLFFVEGEVDLEYKLHIYFASKRLEGEWFNVTEQEIKEALSSDKITKIISKKSEETKLKTAKTTISSANLANNLITPRYRFESSYIESVWKKLAEENNMTKIEYFNYKLQKTGSVILFEAYQENLSDEDFIMLEAYHHRVVLSLIDPVTPFDVFVEQDEAKLKEWEDNKLLLRKLADSLSIDFDRLKKNKIF